MNTEHGSPGHPTHHPLLGTEGAGQGGRQKTEQTASNFSICSAAASLSIMLITSYKTFIKILIFRRFQGQEIPPYLLNLFLFIYLNPCQTNLDSYLIKELRG